MPLIGLPHRISGQEFVPGYPIRRGEPRGLMVEIQRASASWGEAAKPPSFWSR